MYYFLRIVYNLINYSFPDVLESFDYIAGEEVRINCPVGCEDIRVDTPSGESLFLDGGTAIASFICDEVGEYTLTVTASGRAVEYRIHSALPESERMPITASQDFSIQGEAVDGGLDGIYKDLTVIFILLALVFLADWTVYCYEKYQLR